MTYQYEGTTFEGRQAAVVHLLLQDRERLRRGLQGVVNLGDDGFSAHMLVEHARGTLEIDKEHSSSE